MHDGDLKGIPWVHEVSLSAAIGKKEYKNFSADYIHLSYLSENLHCYTTTSGPSLAMAPSGGGARGAMAPPLF